MPEYEGVVIYIQKGEVVKFKHGMLLVASLTNKQCIVKKAKYPGEGRWEAIEKEYLENIQGGERCQNR